MGRFLEVIRNIRHSKTLKMLCPMCLAPVLQRGVGGAEAILPATYTCRYCGYRGHVFVEGDQEVSGGSGDE